MALFSGIRRIWFLVTLLLQIAPFLLTGYISAGENPAPKYRPVMLAENVLLRPGALSWSPDGKRLAFVSGTIKIYNWESKQQDEIDIKEPVYVNWAADNRLFVLSRADNRDVLCTINMANPVIQKTCLDSDADALFPLKDNRRILILSSKVKYLSFGTDTQYSLSIYDRKDGSKKGIYSFRKIYSVKNLNSNFLEGWIHAGVSPLDEGLLMLEYVKPPVVRQYTKIGAIDPVTGKFQPLSENTGKKQYISGSWSPDGRRAALTTEDGRLEIVDIGQDPIPLSSDVSGLYPSWNPMGSQIFVGGHVLDSDGRNREELIQGAFDSVGHWSPDGTRLAVISKEGLRVLEGFSPGFIAPDKPFDEDLAKKILTLKGLLRDGLLTEEEYTIRYKKILGKTKETP
ncbi:MAG: PD40 domain-containing protein [Nitrospirae bacterium]|nr:PD40 domain-containing protein [Nitrospirota bacterium]